MKSWLTIAIETDNRSGIQPRSLAVTMTLPVFAAERVLRLRWPLLLSAWRRAAQSRKMGMIDEGQWWSLTVVPGSESYSGHAR